MLVIALEMLVTIRISTVVMFVDRLTIKNNVFIRQLFIKVSSSDRSYMPQHVTISVGHNVCSMREIKDVRIPA